MLVFTGESNHSRVSWAVQDFVHPQYEQAFWRLLFLGVGELTLPLLPLPEPTPQPRNKRTSLLITLGEEFGHWARCCYVGQSNQRGPYSKADMGVRQRGLKTEALISSSSPSRAKCHHVFCVFFCATCLSRIWNRQRGWVLLVSLNPSKRGTDPKTRVAYPGSPASIAVIR